MFDHYLAIAQPWLDQYGFFAIFISIFTEAFGLPTPGESMLVASALLATKGQLSISGIMLSAWLAAVLGDNVGYMLGRWGGVRFLYKIGVKAEHLQHVEHFFNRYGGGVVVVARFFIILRQLNGVVAGSMGMSWWKFLAFNAVGAALWVSFWGGGVYFLGEHFSRFEAVLHQIEPYIVVLGGLALVYVIYRLRFAK